MNLFDLLDPARGLDDTRRRLAGVAVGIVTNNKDPEGMGRVKVRFPWLSDEDESQWARIAVPMAGDGRGVYFLPEVDDEVLVAFGHGDPRLPYVVGALWNGQDAPPEDNADGKNDVRVIRSRSGHQLRFDDSDAGPRVEIVDSGGNQIVVDTAADVITISAGKDVSIRAGSGKVRLEATKLEIDASADVKIKSGGQMQIEAGATLSLKGALVNIN